ncbi:hypothetical protein SAPIO_CDS2639 [Scedosporium apiospermum]|uniref:DUF7708 domain-containing protein n=1 Tax=Pseudallescheria apiosperma TaxID=563466 RepID=A0A084GCX3_PSEDA|nr:uncharacterized protein SAPIO_CDS2639 [Scedosporium apiospermum]KEZ45185.1 hypothetical protein SAPIO_CDS2639 [Scedosporium apiospermum]
MSRGLDYDEFRQAQNEFLATLSNKERETFSTYISADTFLQSLERLDIIAKKGPSGKRWLNIIRKFSDGLEPYFKVVNIYVSSKPECAAIFWGSLRLVLQLASNYGTFFEKMTKMLSSLTDELPQYGELLDLCQHRGPDTEDEANTLRVQAHIVLIYKDMFAVLHTAARIFAKSDGKMKKKAVVVGSLLWKPFESRFGELLVQMRGHRRFIFEQLVLWHASEEVKERARAAADRKVESVEREDVALERDLAARERKLIREERDLNSQRGAEVSKCLREVRQEMRCLENDRKEQARTRIAEWVAPPNFADSLEKELRLRDPGTAMRLFEEKAYNQGVEGREAVAHSRKFFGSNTIWIQDLILLDILRLCLPEDAILVLDGIDECSDNDFLIESLVGLSHNVPSLRMMLLSRINVAALKSSVRANHIFVAAKNKVSRDIHQFCLNQIQDMFEEELLPESCLGDTEPFADKLCIGADGMFL